ncbi:alpha,alpha-phosphotrehalase [Saccharibacillus kuerlensis]|uniref:Alpha-glucosidase n=1 Tax=Saccharibacillus kuerlensis TaxID=459527 RepID=A0ABQ2L4S1_9BACL|nr:alpha,alpha-phosphotrehalase [Saccharibacillus kuerlensis]GGO02993.1 alpha-glucosidase [Saccharibacillus kuerlensis]
MSRQLPTAQTPKQLQSDIHWKENIVYEVYVRSFNDTNGDGVGDLRGVIEKADYIRDLGVTAVWLSPIFKSPNRDYGYDVTDYMDIDPEYGTLDDFDELLEAFHERGIRLVMEIVPNHTSIDHPWFQAALQGKDNPYRDYYIWRPAREDGGPPNNWTSFLGDPSWKLDEETGEYYLHTYADHQADLNWENPKVREEIHNAMLFWLERGVDGFRIDTANILSKDMSFPDTEETQRIQGSGEEFYKNGPHIHEYLREMREKVFDKYPGIFTMGESSEVTIEEVEDYTLPERRELDLILMIEASKICDASDDMWTSEPWELGHMKSVMHRWLKELHNDAWIGMYLSNHDHVRMVSYLGDDTEYREQSAKMLSVFLMTLRGTPNLLQGEELGMTNAHFFSSIDDIKEQQALAYYDLMVNQRGMESEEILRRVLAKARDHSRTPMQWNDEEGAGFTTGKPWQRINPNKAQINVRQQEEDPESVLNLYRRMIRLRRDNPVLSLGTYEPVLEEDKHIYAYLREREDERWLVVLNFSRTTTQVTLPDNLREDLIRAECIVCSDDAAAEALEGGETTLDPYAYFVFRLY